MPSIVHRSLTTLVVMALLAGAPASVMVPWEARLPSSAVQWCFSVNAINVLSAFTPNPGPALNSGPTIAAFQELSSTPIELSEELRGEIRGGYSTLHWPESQESESHALEAAEAFIDRIETALRGGHSNSDGIDARWIEDFKEYGPNIFRSYERSELHTTPDLLQSDIILSIHQIRNRNPHLLQQAARQGDTELRFCIAHGFIPPQPKDLQTVYRGVTVEGILWLLDWHRFTEMSDEEDGVETIDEEEERTLDWKNTTIDPKIAADFAEHENLFLEYDVRELSRRGIHLTLGPSVGEQEYISRRKLLPLAALTTESKRRVALHMNMLNDDEKELLARLMGYGDLFEMETKLQLDSVMFDPLSRTYSLEEVSDIRAELARVAGSDSEWIYDKWKYFAPYTYQLRPLPDTDNELVMEWARLLNVLESLLSATNISGLLLTTIGEEWVQLGAAFNLAAMRNEDSDLITKLRLRLQKTNSLHSRLVQQAT